jgi:purine-binding chemotaxis protein CheW
MASALLEKPGIETVKEEAERQVVALHLGSEIYGVDIACIHTVLTPQPITEVPNIPSHVPGVINLRGRILPVIDLRTRFGMPPLSPEQKKLSRIVIMEVDGAAAGLIVDSVSEVLRLQVSAIESAGSLLRAADPRCLTGIGRIPGKDGGSERLLLLLDVAEVLNLKVLPE